MPYVNIVGAGMAGLSAAITLAKDGQRCRLISLQPSERAQSVLAEGGINAALDTMGEGDSVREHYEDTMAGGAWLADPEAVRGLAEHAPEIVEWLRGLGVPFYMEGGKLILRNFGGQKKKRTAYARSSTGKAIVSALIDEARKYEAEGLIERFSHHAFVRLLLADAQETEGERLPEDACGAGPRLVGVRVRDVYTSRLIDFEGAVILASGGMNGMFPGMTTGTTANSGDVTAIVHAQGAALANLEMIQYHPTTIEIPGKRCLISEAARGEGGRLYVLRGKQPWYFMEEKYPEYGNLMPRDVVSREMYAVVRREDCGDQVFLDLTGLDEAVWKRKLSDLREEIRDYLGLDPAKEPVPVSPGIHYFMGGIRVDRYHRTNIRRLYAAGECACQYHGANRLGGNSMLGALYGGRMAAMQAAADEVAEGRSGGCGRRDAGRAATDVGVRDRYEADASGEFNRKLGELLASAMGIVRSGRTLQNAIIDIGNLRKEAANGREQARLLLAEEMVNAALERKESLGAHYREDG